MNETLVMSDETGAYVNGSAYTEECDAFAERACLAVESAHEANKDDTNFAWFCEICN